MNNPPCQQHNHRCAAGGLTAMNRSCGNTTAAAADEPTGHVVFFPNNLKTLLPRLNWRKKKKNIKRTKKRLYCTGQPNLCGGSWSLHNLFYELVWSLCKNKGDERKRAERSGAERTWQSRPMTLSTETPTLENGARAPAAALWDL